MKTYLSMIIMDIKLALRLRVVIFFNYLFPLIFFFGFAAFMHRTVQQMVFVENMSVTLGVLGSGFFGAGIRAIQERELNILRRYKVTPITPAPIMVGSMVTGWFLFMPYIIVVIVLAHYIYHVPMPGHIFQLLVFISIGLVAFRSLGLVIASVANTMQEGAILVQLCYFPMLILSGAFIPESEFGGIVKRIHDFIPATYLVRGMHSLLLERGTLWQNWLSAAALLATVAVGGFISIKLFRWEKGEKIRGSAKLWVLVALLPFVAMGIWTWIKG